jgi:hypothetical protein
MHTRLAHLATVVVFLGSLAEANAGPTLPSRVGKIARVAAAAALLCAGAACTPSGTWTKMSDVETRPGDTTSHSVAPGHVSHPTGRTVVVDHRTTVVDHRTALPPHALDHSIMLGRDHFVVEDGAIFRILPGDGRSTCVGAAGAGLSGRVKGITDYRGSLVAMTENHSVYLLSGSRWIKLGDRLDHIVKTHDGDLVGVSLTGELWVVRRTPIGGARTSQPVFQRTSVKNVHSVATSTYGDVLITFRNGDTATLDQLRHAF